MSRFNNKMQFSFTTSGLYSLLKNGHDENYRYCLSWWVFKLWKKYQAVVIIAQPQENTAGNSKSHNKDEETKEFLDFIMHI